MRFFFRTPLLSPESYTSSQSIHPALSPHSSAICAYACLLACVSHRSLLRGRQPSWGDAWVPPVNYTAFIWPDEWLAALSVPLPAISSGSPEPRAACSFRRFPQRAVLLPHAAQPAANRGTQLPTDNIIPLDVQFRNDTHINSKQHTNRGSRKARHKLKRTGGQKRAHVN